MKALPLLLALGGLALLWLARRFQRASGLPAGELRYQDTVEASRTRRTLFDPRLGLAGRPDYLVDNGQHIIPVEVKSGVAPSSPYAGHRLQLAAYCHLVEVDLGRRPPLGIIRYQDQSFELAYGGELRSELEQAVAQLRSVTGLPDRSHQSAVRCRACGHADHCDQRLA